MSVTIDLLPPIPDLVFHRLKITVLGEVFLLREIYTDEQVEALKSWVEDMGYCKNCEEKGHDDPSG